jgi:hypothetical protein
MLEESNSVLSREALVEATHDSRRHGLLLMLVLVVAIIFFALGIVVGRWILPRDPSGPSQISQPTGRQ